MREAMTILLLLACGCTEQTESARVRRARQGGVAGSIPATRAPYCRHQENGSESARVRVEVSRLSSLHGVGNARHYDASQPKRIRQGRASASKKPATRADTLDKAWKAICMVESGGDPNAYNAAEGALGIAQIRGILVRDVNRIVGYEAYKLDDRACGRCSREMFRVYSQHYARSGTVEEVARIWCAGPRGMSKVCSLPYWRKVQERMAQIEGE